MNLLSPFFNPKRIEIPKVFHSTITKEPFSECVMCKKNLHSSEVHYFVEKAIRKYPNGTTDTIFEYAICMECSLEVRDTLSKDSMERIDEFFSTRLDLMNRWNNFNDKDNFRFNDWVNDCIVTGKHVDELEEYQIYAHCEGKYMLFSLMPYIISSEVIEEAFALLSQHTKDELDNFMDNYLGPDPEVKKLLKDHKPVFIF
jgi:hypothetical protein